MMGIRLGHSTYNDDRQECVNDPLSELIKSTIFVYIEPQFR